MVRNIIKIDEDLCIGCGLCVNACQESAIQLIDGKAKLVRDDYCDGLGNCLPVCPTDAISFEQRKALPFDKDEVLKNQERLAEQEDATSMGCPGTRAKTMKPKVATASSHSMTSQETISSPVSNRPSMLNQWPVQIQLVQANASFFDGAKLLIAADCCAYAHADFHNFMKDKVTLIGCPKLDELNYADKLTEILKYNDIKSLTLTKVEVPCCLGLLNAVQNALANSGKVIPWSVVTISVDGDIIEEL